MITQYKDIRKRLEEAEGPDRGIDYDLDWLFRDADKKKLVDGVRYVMGTLDWLEFDGVFEYGEAKNPYTASIDAALALVERALPGMTGWLLNKALQAVTRDGVQWHAATTDKLARAIIVALLPALEASDNE